MKRCLSCDRSFADAGWRCRSCGYEPAVRDGMPFFAPDAISSGEGFDERSFELLPAVEEGSFWFRSRNRLIAWALRKHFPRAGSMLELGCGTGFVLGGVAKAFPRLRLVGGELFPAGLAVAATRAPGAELLQMDARHVPFEGEFDVVGAFDVLEHVEEDEDVVRQAHRALRSGGGLLVTVPQHPRLWSGVDDFSRHVRRYRRGELVEKLRRGGFEVVRCTSFVSLLLPLLALSRLRQRGDRGFDPLEEYGHPRFVDSALACVMAAEGSLIRAGLSLPAGGSLLAVARRR